MARRQSKALDVGDVFASRLREARSAKGWTQQDLADALGKIGWPMDRTTLAKIEKGQRAARLQDVIAMAAALDVAPTNMFLPINGKDPVRLAPDRTVDIVHARSWARGRKPLDPANAQFYSYQSPGDIGVSMEGATPEQAAEAMAEFEDHLTDGQRRAWLLLKQLNPKED